MSGETGHGIGEATRGRIVRARNLGFLIGLVGLAACGGLGVLAGSKADALRPYLVGYVFWFGISLGGVALTMLHHLTGGGWGLLIRRPLEAAGLTILPIAILFTPIALGVADLYPWGDPAFVAAHEAVEHKAAYLNPNAFLMRSAIYFTIWGVSALILAFGSRAQDRREDRGPTRRLATFSGPGLGLVFLTTTFACVDWLMSLEPDWYSSIYAVMLICGWGLATFAAMTIVAYLLKGGPETRSVATPGRFHDLGNLTLAFTMLWAYMSFMQFLIIWCGNLVEEIPWYLRRTRGGWGWFAVALILFHFFGPFFVLLARDVKRNAGRLATLAGLILAMHLVEHIWLVLPSQYLDPLATSSDRVAIPWTQLASALAATAGVGGVWVGCFALFLGGAPLVPTNDPSGDHLDRAHADVKDSAGET